MLVPSTDVVRRNLYDCAIKLLRAHDHRNALQEVRAELGGPNYLTAEFESDGVYRVGRLKILAPLPPRISCILGDLVHNARSSLDHLACVMVKAGGGSVTREIQFPVCDTPKTFHRAAAKQLAGAPQAFVDFVATLQPFQLIGTNYLQLLTDLDNKDKHREVLVSAMLPSHIEFTAQGPENAVQDTRFPAALPFPLSDHVELVRFWLSPDVSLEKLAIKIDLGAELVFAETGPLFKVAVVPFAYALLKYLEEEVFTAVDHLLDTL